ncbi:hypothetical protein CLV92_1054 [Kineococcus xinjiangensis]|uniref:Uncharacterized protein n=1 Tax=Kineococcus xinjiangensis TaxID=512762 RepID=A0A2S6IP49_9ACTN|nr:hypothetical protein [Kineococcus xinjiangensis]PPK95910.1 hypothetical protein CLV92_1054 [Kineococcus xinjiangensis]
MFDQRRSGRGAAPRVPGAPPGWPPGVLPPAAPDFEASAVAWLLDQAPPEYRAYPAARRHPVLLVWLVAHHVDAQAEAVRRAVATARVDLSDVLPVEMAPRVFELLEREDLRLRRVRRAVALLQEALHGRRYVPRL